jgi:hypothetical protein
MVNSSVSLLIYRLSLFVQRGTCNKKLHHPPDGLKKINIDFLVLFLWRSFDYIDIELRLWFHNITQQKVLETLSVNSLVV